jgi:GntR family transcriptional regulator
MLPLYAQLKEALIAAIQRGELAPGDQLPSQSKLREQYRMSHMTVRRAINELISEGVIYSIPGKGSYVAERKLPSMSGALVGFYEHMRRINKVPSNRLLEAKIVSASTILASRLGIESGLPLVYIRRLRLVDGIPMSIAMSYLPHFLCPGLLTHDLVNGSLFAILRDVYGLSMAASRSTIGAALANEEQAQLLEIARPAALITEEQVTYLGSGQAIEFSRSVIRGDRYCVQLQEGPNVNLRRPVVIDQQDNQPQV